MIRMPVPFSGDGSRSGGAGWASSRRPCRLCRRPASGAQDGRIDRMILVAAGKEIKALAGPAANRCGGMPGNCGGRIALRSFALLPCRTTLISRARPMPAAMRLPASEARDPAAQQQASAAEWKMSSNFFWTCSNCRAARARWRPRTRPKVVENQVQLAFEYAFSSIVIELKSKLIFFLRAARRSLVL